MKKSWTGRGVRLCVPLLLSASSVLTSCGVNEGASTPTEGTTDSASSSLPPAPTDPASSPQTTSVQTSNASPVTQASGDASASTSTTTQAPVPPPAFEPAPVMLRRLTRAQFRNAVHDVLDFDVNVNELDPDNWDGDFATIGAGRVVTSEHGVEQYHQAIENAVNVVFSDRSRAEAFVGCNPTADDACTQTFVQRIGRLAWRRPLDSDETARVVGLARTALAEFEDAMEGMRFATLALFWSPNFLYRSELGTTAQGDALRYSGYEMASRLAFLLWNSAPDAELLDAAARGELDTPAGVRSAAARMLDGAAGREAVGSFADQYMRLDRVPLQAKDRQLFPEYGAELQAAMIEDMRKTWQSVVFDDDASVMELFSTDQAYVNADLARLYGLDDSELDSDTFQRVTLPQGSPRLGILSKAAFLSQFANQEEGSPTLRGKFIRQTLMCMPVPSPPGGIDLVIDKAPADMPMTKRERLALHRESDGCAGCHALMDPLGLPLETFDAIGRYRTTELGLQIDPSGQFDGKPVADAREMGLAASESETVAKCLVRKFYSYALGFPERSVDRSVIEELTTTFRQSGYKLRELILALTAHDTFSTAVPQADSTATEP